MTTDSCERCGDTAPEALLRDIELRVDGSEVDEQTVCPDCFADWIAHYQQQMAGDMPGASDDSDPVPSESALNEAVAAAQEQRGADGDAEPAAETAVDGVSESDGGGNEIREVGGSTRGDGGDVEVDLGSESDVDEDDDGGLLLG